MSVEVRFNLSQDSTWVILNIVQQAKQQENTFQLFSCILLFNSDLYVNIHCSYGSLSRPLVFYPVSFPRRGLLLSTVLYVSVEPPVGFTTPSRYATWKMTPSPAASKRQFNSGLQWHAFIFLHHCPLTVETKSLCFIPQLSFQNRGCEMKSYTPSFILSQRRTSVTLRHYCNVTLGDFTGIHFTRSIS